MNAVVVALGKIGLPLAVQIARAGHRVAGCDVDAEVCRLVNEGTPPFPGEEGLEEALREVVEGGLLRAGGDTAAAVAEGVDLVVAVPPLVVDADGAPDFSAVDAVAEDIGRGLRPGTTVSFETTLPVGVTRGRIAPRLEEASGLRAGEDFHLVHSPERVSSGRVFRDLAAYPKLVGGLEEAGERRAVELYRLFLSAEVRPMGTAEAAELTKLAETTYRHLNIALANELARYADRTGIDVRCVIDAANSQPFSHIHRPGVAVGGHCLPVYPHFYLSGDPEARLPRAAVEVNEAMPAYAIDLLEEELGVLDGRPVLVLGIAYRGGVKETSFSGAYGLQSALRERGAEVVAADPLYSDEEIEELGFRPWRGEEVEGAVVQADHPEYARLGPGDLPGIRAVVDGRDVLASGPFLDAGVAIRSIGRPAGGRKPDPPS